MEIGFCCVGIELIQNSFCEQVLLQRGKGGVGRTRALIQNVSVSAPAFLGNHSAWEHRLPGLPAG